MNALSPLDEWSRVKASVLLPTLEVFQSDGKACLRGSLDASGHPCDPLTGRLAKQVGIGQFHGGEAQCAQISCTGRLAHSSRSFSASMVLR